MMLNLPKPALGPAAGCSMGLAVFLTLSTLLCCRAWADKDIQLSAGSSQVVSVHAPLRVAIGSPEVADVRQINDEEFLISGKAIGTTTLIVWHQNGQKDVSTILVTASQAAQTMVQVDVQVVEITQSEDKNLGLDWEKLLGPANEVLTLKETTAPLQAVGTLERGKLDLLLKLLDQSGTGKILARPKLLTLSGRKASFSSGGEIPFSVQGANGQANVEWKKYGVNLDVLPTASNTKDITVDIRAEVSDVDFDHLVQGNPAIKTRWAQSVIQVAPGSTVVIGGLMQEKNQVSHQGLPILSDIPILGYLFKSSRIIRENSELVIFVTPRSVGR